MLRRNPIILSTIIELEWLMKKFLAIYIGTASAFEAWMKMDVATREAREKTGKEAWGKWVMDNKKAIVDIGTPLGKTKRIDPHGIADTKNQLSAYTIVQAESHEAAAKLFEQHPHFTIFPGESIEIMECMPMPTM